MSFDDNSQHSNSEDFSSDHKQIGHNRLNNSNFMSGNKLSNQLDMSELVKFWDAPQSSEDLSLSLDGSGIYHSSEKWDLLAEALYKDEMFEYSEPFNEEYFDHQASDEELETKFERVMSSLAIAIQAREQEELAKSRTHLQQALREFLEFSHTEEQDNAEVQSLMGQIFLEMANQFLETDDLLSAYRFACHTVKLAFEIKEDSLYANAIATLGVVIGLDGQLDLSFQLLSEAADRHREMDDHEGYIIDLMNLGELVSRDGMWETSATLLDQAIELARHHECIDLFLKASEIRNDIESIIRVKQTDPQRN